MKVGIRRPSLKRGYATSPSTTYLNQLKKQRATLEKLLKAQQESDLFLTSEGVRTTIEIYKTILEDAVKTLNSLIDHLASMPE